MLNKILLLEFSRKVKADTVYNTVFYYTNSKVTAVITPRGHNRAPVVLYHILLTSGVTKFW